MAEKKEIAEAAVARWWVQCTKCLKWRRGTRGKHYADKFICSDLAGISCRTVVEDAAKHGRPKEEDFGSEEEIVGLVPSIVSGGELKRSHKRQARGWGKGKRPNPTCQKCGQKMERYAAGKERHYRISPLCRPVHETTPGVIAGLVLDLSDRLPYMAVLRKDMRMWENFTTRTKACTTFDQAARELLWLFKQLKPIVFDANWNEKRAQSFREECETCSSPEQALKLLQRMELEAIDWHKVFELWETERSEETVDQPAKKRQKDRHGGKRRRTTAEADRKPEDGYDEEEGEEGVRYEEGMPKEDEYEEDEDEDEDEYEDEGEEEGEDGEEEELEAEWRGDGEEEKVQEEKEEEVYTVGTVVEVRLDDDEQALAIISALPAEEGSGAAGSGGEDEGKHQVTFLDDKQQIALDDTLMLELPNEFVKVLLPCEPVPGLPRGWIPVPAGEAGEERRFVGPQGQVCGSVAEIRKTAHLETGG